MDLSFEQLKSMVVFAHVVEHGSFSAAARQLELSRAVVSYHVKKLETQLGIKLLNRSTRSLAVTEAGQVYYESCRAIAQQASSVQRKIDHFKNEPDGLLRITCPVNLGVELIVPALNEFRNIYPKISLDVHLTDEVSNVLHENFDLAIRGAPMADSGLQATRLAILDTCICGSVDYLNRRGRPATPKDLDQHDWVIYRPGPKHIELQRGAKSFSIEMTGPVATNNASARTAFVLGGQGLGRIPVYDANPKLRSNLLEQILSDYVCKPINLFGVFPPDTASVRKLRLLLDFLKGRLSQAGI